MAAAGQDPVRDLDLGGMDALRTDDDRAAPPGPQRRAIAVLVVVGGVAVAGSVPIARAVGKALPGRAEVRSTGTNFPSFREVAPTIVARTGLILIAVAVAIAVASALQQRHRRWRRAPKWARPGAQVAVAAGAAALYGWLATPHHAHRSNARFHWVDYLSWDSDNFFYAAGQLPHLVFYDHPPAWQALNAAVLVLVLAWISNLLRLGLAASIVLCATPIFASNLLMFADTAEDLLLNATLIAVLVAALLARRPVLVGLALAATILGRPHFLVLVACLPAAEAAVVLRRRSPSWAERVRHFDWLFTVVAVGTAAVATFVAQVIFTILGQRYLFTGGRIVDTGTWDAVDPTAVGGFEISPFSGAYLLHLLWVMPLVLLVGTVVAGVVARRLPIAEEATIYFCVAAVVAIVLIHESNPLAYYNVRYITYAWPFLLVAAWIAYARLAPAAVTIRTAVVVALAAGLAVLPVHPIEAKRDVEAREDIELLSIRREIDELVGDGTLMATFGDHATRNVLAYLVRDDPHDIEVSAPAVDDAVVITTRHDPLPGRTPLYGTESLLVYPPVGHEG